KAAAHAAACADGLLTAVETPPSNGDGSSGSSAAGSPAAHGGTGNSVVGGGGRAGTRSGGSVGLGSPRAKQEAQQALAHQQQAGGVRNGGGGGAGSSGTMLGAMLGGRGGHKKQKPPGLRRGKWTPEEEKYANRLIQEFKAGLLPLTDGTTLRTFLSIMLNCDPMRISKKFVGSNCIGKQVFRRQQGVDEDSSPLSEEAMDKSRAELAELERKFLERVAETTSKLKQGGGRGGGGGGGVGASG
ncbi:unnamed protein product, partial [Ectocarpus fasciculatus]